MKAAGKRQKGSRGERELQKLLHGSRIRGRTLTARRVPLSGAMSSTGFGGDLLVGDACPFLHSDMDRTGLPCENCGESMRKSAGTTPDTEEIWEVKSRATAFRSIYKWLEDAAILAVRSDRHGWLVVMRLEDYIEKAGSE